MGGVALPILRHDGIHFLKGCARWIYRFECCFLLSSSFFLSSFLLRIHCFYETFLRDFSSSILCLTLEYIQCQLPEIIGSWIKLPNFFSKLGVTSFSDENLRFRVNVENKLLGREVVEEEEEEKERDFLVIFKRWKRKNYFKKRKYRYFSDKCNIRIQLVQSSIYYYSFLRKVLKNCIQLRGLGGIITSFYNFYFIF